MVADGAIIRFRGYFSSYGRRWSQVPAQIVMIKLNNTIQRKHEHAVKSPQLGSHSKFEYTYLERSTKERSDFKYKTECRLSELIVYSEE